MKTKEDLKFQMINEGWGEMDEHCYPRPYVGDWLKIVHPEIMNEYRKWFDENIRGK